MALLHTMPNHLDVISIIFKCLNYFNVLYLNVCIIECIESKATVRYHQITPVDLDDH